MTSAWGSSGDGEGSFSVADIENGNISVTFHLFNVREKRDVMRALINQLIKLDNCWMHEKYKGD